MSAHSPLTPPTTAYWLVWARVAHQFLREHTPTVQHQTPEAAIQEAHRLSIKNPGVEYVVLQAVTHVVAEVRTTVRYHTIPTPAQPPLS